MVASAPAVPFWQSMPASILKDYRKQIPTQPRSRSAIRLALVTALILGLIALTAMKYCQDKVLGSPRFTYSVLYDPAYTPPAEQQRKQGKPSEEAESRTCPCRVRTLPWGSFAAWNTSALQAYLAPAQTAAFATNNTASAYDTAFMNAQVWDPCLCMTGMHATGFCFAYTKMSLHANKAPLRFMPMRSVPVWSWAREPGPTTSLRLQSLPKTWSCSSRWQCTTWG
jgi:hypothetical protein